MSEYYLASITAAEVAVVLAEAAESVAAAVAVPILAMVGPLELVAIELYQRLNGGMKLTELK